jgi:hypothetical protein
VQLYGFHGHPLPYAHAGNVKLSGLNLFLGAKSTSIRDCVRRSVGPSVGPSPTMQLRGKLVTSRLLQEEEEEEETDYVAIPSHLGIR